MCRSYLVFVCLLCGFFLQCKSEREVEGRAAEIELPTVNCEDMGDFVESIVDRYGNPTGDDQFTLTLTSPPDPRGGYLQHRIPLMQLDDTVQVRVMHWEYPDGRYKYLWLIENEGRWWVFHGIDYRGIAAD